MQLPYLKDDPPIFAAVADPVRRSILLNLAENSPRTATQLTDEYPMTRQGLLKHITILKNAGLVSVHQEGRDKLFTLNPAPLKALSALEFLINQQWDKRLNRLKNLLEE